jgi:hypothetical protein
MAKNKSKMVALMREEYERHLNKVLNELNVFDSRGELIIGSDLKVVHEPSGLEYTVVGVEGNPGAAKITLRTPEQPRKTAVDPTALHPDFAGKAVQPGEQFVAEDGDDSMTDQLPDRDDNEDSLSPSSDDEEEDKKDYGIAAHPKAHEKPAGDEGDDDTVFIINQKEFEKHYREA